LPPLRERGDDILLLSHHFLKKLASRMDRQEKRLASDALDVLRAYDWPGNVRELEHALEHAFVLAPEEVIRGADLPIFDRPSSPPDTYDEADVVIGIPTPAATPAAGGASSGGEGLRVRADVLALSYGEAKRRVLSDFDDVYLRDVLRRASGNFSEAARLAGLDRSNFKRIVKKRDRP
jgi:DNA-binding NtrC family response regulator